MQQIENYIANMPIEKKQTKEYFQYFQTVCWKVSKELGTIIVATKIRKGPKLFQVQFFRKSGIYILVSVRLLAALYIISYTSCNTMT